MKSSALIPFRTEEHLLQSIQSCRQYYDDVICYADDATPEAYSIALLHATQVYQSPNHVYAFEARNRLLNHTDADIVTFHDSDDYRLPATARHLELLKASTADVLITPYEGRSLEGDVLIDMALGNVQTGGIYIKKSVFEKGYPRKAHAWENWMLTDFYRRGCSFSYDNEPGVYYRRDWSDNQITTQSYTYVEASRSLCFSLLLSHHELTPLQYNALHQALK
jgi:glycosyltransferase involved in cell wall biosynthesis